MTGNKEAYADYLHQHAIKSTRPRNLVLTILEENEGILTAEDIYRRIAADHDAINFSTVYRVLELFTSKGIVEKSNFPGSTKCVFSLKREEHAHHLICLGCHKTIELCHCPLQAFERDVEKTTGFTIVGHQLELFGYCETCKKKLLIDEKDG